MLSRGYLILGSLLLCGYSFAEFRGWEFGNPVQMRPAPRAGAILAGRSFWSSSSGSRSHSSYGRSSGGFGGFGGK